MFKYIALILVAALVAITVSYTNEVVTQYNELSAADKLFTVGYCNGAIRPLTIQDHVDCYIVNTF